MGSSVNKSSTNGLIDLLVALVVDFVVPFILCFRGL